MVLWRPEDPADRTFHRLEVDMRRITAVFGAIALFAITPALGVAAAPGPTPNELTGALNMAMDPSMGYTMGTYVSDNGNAGMVCAVQITAFNAAPGSCAPGR